MDKPTKEGGEEEADNRKKPATVATEGEKGRAGPVPSGSNFANQEGRPKVVDIRPGPEPKSSNDSSEQKSASAGSSSAAGSAGNKIQDGSLPKKPKKDRSNLRKGKWTVEEEEYTSRIIHYFGTGLLTLPEGATLRSYLADKLNCDPMRITKKYAGASCLGRRVHQFRDRPTPTVAEIQLAKAELDHLEQRFRMRVEEGYSSMPMNPQPDIMFSLAQQANQFLMNSMGTAPPPPPAAPQNVLPPWLFALSQQQAAPPAPPGLQAASGLSEQAKVLANLANLGASLPWLLPNAAANPQVGFPTPPPNAGIPDANTIAGWAFAQAAASLAPAITQLAAVNYQQQQQLQQAPKPTPPVDPMKEISARLKESRDAESLRRALQAAIASNPSIASQPPSNGSSSQAGAPPVTSRPRIPAVQRVNQTPAVQQQQQQVQQPAAPPLTPAPSTTAAAAAAVAASPRPPQSGVETSKGAARPYTLEENRDGGLLLGFLSSLRQSYEEAVKEKEETEASAPQQQNNNGTKRPQTLLQDSLKNAQKRSVAVISDTSSGTGQPESSLEESDWHSDKKTETSSSEDSDKEINGSASKGPPRKRLKTKRAADERQRESRN